MPRKKTEQDPNTQEAQSIALDRQLKAAKRLLRTKKARESLIEYTRLMMPDPEDPDNADLSRYHAAEHHHVIAAALEEVEKGNMPRLIISIPPRHGKSQLTSKCFPAWFMGKDPYRQVAVASYNATMAEDFGKEVRQYMQSHAHKQVFPGCTLRKGGAASDRIQTEQGGIAAFVGVGGALTGRGADLLIIDDPIKDREEADSQVIRDKQWEWFTAVAMTRLMGEMGRVVIIHTRWHEDDMIGRLTDPSNKHYNHEIASQYKIINLAAIAEDGDPMGRKKGEALWPERYPITFLNAQRALSPKNFAALYQGSPAPEDGDFFKKDWLSGYMPNELPRDLRIYSASDHAVSTKEEADATCLMTVGVDDRGHIWILPELWWRRQDTEHVVDAMLNIMALKKPLVWWAEKGHISKSIGPFLRKRMLETQTYINIQEVTPIKDKRTRAQAIQGRMSMGMVHFPKFAPWYAAAENELLKFPSGKHDDFVDALAWIGMGLAQIVSATLPAPPKPKMKPGSLEWIRHQEKLRKRDEARKKKGGF